MRFLYAIPAALYGFALIIRHWLFNSGIKRGYSADIPVICVGNITVGGTGKTPVVEFLINELSGNYKIAVLSRGYGRNTKGYIEVCTESDYHKVGDEPRQIKANFPNTVVVVCESRKEGIKRIRAEHPEVNMILMDDGFQHRHVKPLVNIVLMDYNRPIYSDHLLPWGNLRDLKSQLNRANIVLVTKTPSSMTPIERRLMQKKLRLYPYQSLFFTSMEQGAPVPLFPDSVTSTQPKKDIAVMSGIGNPAYMATGLKEKYNVMASYTFPDHHAYKKRELNKIAKEISALPADTIVVTTEKDGVKFTNANSVPEELRKRLFTVPVKLMFPEDDKEEFIKTLNRNVKEN